MWLSPEGPLGMGLAHEGERGEECLLRAFVQATTEPMRGAPARPDRVRVASAEMAAWLRPRLGDVAVVCAPTPELDLMMASLGEFLAAQGPARDPSFLDHESTADQVAALFRAAAALFRAGPWQVIPDDASALSVTCERLGLSQAAVSVIGQLGESLGFLCFDSMDDFEDYLDAASESAAGQGLPEGVPPHIALSFETGAEIDPALRKEVSKHRWEVAAATAYPSLYAISGGLTLRPLTRLEVLRLEVLCLALVDLATAPPPGLGAAWETGEPVVHTVTVASSEGPIEITLRAPHEDDDGALGDLDPLSEERGPTGSLDPDWYEAHRDFVMDSFVQSPEAARLDQVALAPLFLDLAFEYLDATLLGLTPEQARRVLFELVPRKVSAPPEIAVLIVEEMKALLSFARRAWHLEHLDATLRTLNVVAMRRLRKELESPRHGGLLKSMLMAGQAAGFDLSTQEGIDAWMASTVAAPPGAPPAPPGRAKAAGASASKAGASKVSKGKAGAKAPAGARKPARAKKTPGKGR